MNSTRVQQSLTTANALFNDQASYSNLSTGDLIGFLQNEMTDITADLQLAFDCLTKFKCRGFKVEEKIGAQIDIATCLNLEDHEARMRELLKEYAIAKEAE